jgi:hypothetical protein
MRGHAITTRAFSRWMLWVGLSGTLGLVVLGLWTLVSRVWAASFTQTLEVLVVSPFLAAWVLAPVLWAVRPRDESPTSQVDAVVSATGAGLLVGVAAYGYLPDFVVLPVFFDVQPGLDSLMLVLIVPGCQWGILALVGAIRSIRSSGATRR